MCSIEPKRCSAGFKLEKIIEPDPLFSLRFVIFTGRGLGKCQHKMPTREASGQCVTFWRPACMLLLALILRPLGEIDGQIANVLLYFVDETSDLPASNPNGWMIIMVDFLNSRRAGLSD